MQAPSGDFKDSDEWSVNSNWLAAELLWLLESWFQGQAEIDNLILLHGSAKCQEFKRPRVYIFLHFSLLVTDLLIITVSSSIREENRWKWKFCKWIGFSCWPHHFNPRVFFFLNFISNYFANDKGPLRLDLHFSSFQQQYSLNKHLNDGRGWCHLKSPFFKRRKKMILIIGGIPAYWLVLWVCVFWPFIGTKNWEQELCLICVERWLFSCFSNNP